tara:strand:+ start:9861 stop:10931 length:1071 start_codon:yes stop_codon:yes gene_type:complete
MAYIGIDPNVGDIAFQKFAGTGSATSFTLSQNVTSGEAILVTVGNVLQEPGASASYTANGTTLEFSEAPANGDDIVVRFLGRAVDQPLSFAMQVFKYVATSNQTAFTGADSAGAILAFGSDVDVYLNGVHLDTTDFTLSGGDTVTLASGATVNDELVVRAFRSFAATDTVSKASGGAFTGAVTATGGLNVGTIKDASATSTAMTIDSSGRVILSAIPYIRLEVTGTPSTAIGSDSIGIIPLNNVIASRGITHNTSTFAFQVPVAGLYNFQGGLRWNSSSANYLWWRVAQTDGTLVQNVLVINTGTTGSFISSFGSIILPLAASTDYRIEFGDGSASTTTSVQGGQSFMTIHLVGGA